VDSSRVAGLHKDVPLGDQIVELLKHGALTRAEVASELDKSPSHIGKELSTLKERGKVIQVGDNRWGAMA
jgi:predicted HTH transcriptional regulator